MPPSAGSSATSPIHRDSTLADVRSLLRSKWHEERALALLVLVERYRRDDEAGQERRIAVLGSRSALKRGEFGPTLALAKALLADPHDLIH